MIMKTKAENLLRRLLGPFNTFILHIIIGSVLK